MNQTEFDRFTERLKLEVTRHSGLRGLAILEDPDASPEGFADQLSLKREVDVRVCESCGYPEITVLPRA